MYVNPIRFPMKPTHPLRLGLTKKQAHVLNSTATEILFGGASGPGKSHLLRVAAILFSLWIPGLQVYLFRREFPDLTKNHILGPSGFPALLAPYIRAGWVRRVKNDFIFWNGSRINLCHCQHEKDIWGYHGTEMHLLLIDEATTFPDSMYRFLRRCVRMVGIHFPPQFAHLEQCFPRIIGATNPGGLSHNSFKAGFVDPVKANEIWRTPKSEGGLLRQYIPALYTENPFLMKYDPDFMDRIEGLGNPALTRAYKTGDWNIVAGGFFDDLWNPEVHVLEPFDIPRRWFIDRSFDWGSSRPFSVGWWAESNGEPAPNGKRYPKGTMFRIGEWYGWNGNVNQGLKMKAKDIARGIIEKEKLMKIYGRVNPGPADPSIWDGSRGKSTADKMAAEKVYWEKGNNQPGSRVAGGSVFREYMEATTKWPIEDPALFIFNRCTQFIRTVPALMRDQKNQDDVDTTQEDHTYDEARYKLASGDAYKSTFDSLIH